MTKHDLADPVKADEARRHLVAALARWDGPGGVGLGYPSAAGWKCPTFPEDLQLAFIRFDEATGCQLSAAAKVKFDFQLGEDDPQ